MLGESSSYPMWVFDLQFYRLHTMQYEILYINSSLETFLRIITYNYYCITFIIHSGQWIISLNMSFIEVRADE